MMGLEPFNSLLLPFGSWQKIRGKFAGKYASLYLKVAHHGNEPTPNTAGFQDLWTSGLEGYPKPNGVGVGVGSGLKELVLVSTCKVGQPKRW